MSMSILGRTEQGNYSLVLQGSMGSKLFSVSFSVRGTEENYGAALVDAVSKAGKALAQTIQVQVDLDKAICGKEANG